ncbi:MAG: fluoride efflux transporter CrcB [Nitrososphaerota archaeon]|nr:fluoride efflux transporter CrcB [Nitrososphaerota archaeon]
MEAEELILVGLVAVGSAIGGVSRYAVTGLLSREDFPWGTFAVNFSGAFLVGLLFYFFLGRGYLSTELRTFLFVGIFGGYTTFSTFGLETVNMLREGETILAGWNIFLNAGLCLLGAVVGAAIGVFLGA